jgi:hypothetical protein
MMGLLINSCYMELISLKFGVSFVLSWVNSHPFGTKLNVFSVTSC